MIWNGVLLCALYACMQLSALQCAAIEGTYNWRLIPEFSAVPSADEEGIVVDARVINFPGAKRMYNPSIEKQGDGFVLAVRQDLPGTAWPIPHAMISLWNLDTSLQLQGGGSLLSLLDNHSEDPRLFYFKGSLYMLYVHVTDPRPEWKCTQALAKIDAKDHTVTRATDLTFPGIAPREKNWTPLKYTDTKGVESLYFLYSYNPLTVVQMTNEKKGTVVRTYTEKDNPLLNAWEGKWGKIRGGTPAIRINENEYIAFFHSTFWQYVRYVMGAVIIDAHPPFAIKKISPYPILFKGAYDSTPLRSEQTILFPGGVVEDRVGGRDVFQVACGENDNAVKIVTIDKEALLKNMVSVAEEQ